MSLTLIILGLILAMSAGIYWAARRYARRFTSKLWSLDNQFHADHGHDPNKKPDTTQGAGK